MVRDGLAEPEGLEVDDRLVPGEVVGVEAVDEDDGVVPEGRLGER